jgi:hypothetical protein
MSETVFLDCPDADAVPSARQIAEIAGSTRQLVVRFPSMVEIVRPEYPSLRKTRDLAQDFKTRLLEELTSLLPTHTVFDAGTHFDEKISKILNQGPIGTTISGISQLTLLQVIAEETVLIHADAIVQAAQRFRSHASELAGRLALKLNVLPEAFANPLFRLEYDPSGDNPVSVLDAEWNYWFHGFECAFGNSRTGEYVEVALGFRNEFGVLDPYFFAKYLQSVPEYQSLAQLFEDDYHDAQRAFEILENHRRLQRVSGASLDFVDGTTLQMMGLIALPE